MTDDQFFHLDVNPEPWAIGPLFVGKHGGKMVPKVGRNQQLASYKEAVAEAVSSLPGGTSLVVSETGYDLYFWFWRRLDTYETKKGAKHTKHQVDATNLQKATEDALQGVLIENDRDVRIIGSEIIEQGPEVKPGVVIRIRPYVGEHSQSMQIPSTIWQQVLRPAVPKYSDNEWGYN